MEPVSSPKTTIVSPVATQNAHDRHTTRRIRIGLIILGGVIAAGGILFAFYWYKTGRFVADPRKMPREKIEADMAAFSERFPKPVLTPEQKSVIDQNVSGIGITVTPDMQKQIEKDMERRPNKKPW